MAENYYRYCETCKHKVVGHAFSDGICTICKENVSCSHTPCDDVCRKCSLKEEVCMSCGDTLGWKPEVWSFEKQGDGNYINISPLEIEYVDPLSIETIVALYNEENKNQLTKVETLTSEEIMEKYGHILSDKEIKYIKNHGNIESSGH